MNSFATDRVYDHLSDVVYHSGVQPRADGSLFTGSTAASHLAALKNHQAQFGFRYHLDMYDAVRNSGETAADAVERVWNAITSNPTTRATFINNVKNVLAANNMTGFNLDWERPNTVTEWGNYTQLAREMQAAFPEHWEVSVDDYGFARLAVGRLAAVRRARVRPDRHHGVPLSGEQWNVARPAIVCRREEGPHRAGRRKGVPGFADHHRHGDVGADGTDPAHAVSLKNIVGGESQPCRPTHRRSPAQCKISTA